MKKMKVEFIVPEYINVEDLVGVLQEGSEHRHYLGHSGYCKLNVEPAFGEGSVSIVMIEAPPTQSEGKATDAMKCQENYP